MEPSIQYAKTKDGVRIAFSTMGEGDVLIYMPQPVQTSIQTALRVPETRSWQERLARGRRLVRYDCRGSGLSQRDISDYSVDRMRLDLEAVVDRLGVETLSIWAEHDSGPIAIAYVARHPDRVKALALWCSWAVSTDLNLQAEMSEIEAIEKLIETNQRLYLEVVAETMGGMSPALARRFAAISCEAASPEDLKRFGDQAWNFDVTALLPSIRCPTLVLHPREQHLLRMEVGARLAAGIPGAQFVMLDDDSGVPWLRDSDGVASRLDEFLGEGEEAAPEQSAGAAVHTILFTDIESSTATRQRLGDAKAQEILHAHNTIVRDALRAHGGGEIKHTGDGIMASFPSASGALECAVTIQRAVAAHAEEHPEMPLRVYIGMNAGEPISEEGDLFGTSVDLAKRICDQCEPGEILVSDVVRQLAAGKGFLFSDKGEVVPKGFDEVVRLYEVRWREEG